MANQTTGNTTELVQCGDDVEMDMQVSNIDPITKQPLENPCRNKICKHVYGMNSVTEALRLNAGMRCPIVGCANKKKVKLDDLVLDKELARKLHAQRSANH